MCSLCKFLIKLYHNKFKRICLILVDFAVFVLLFTLPLKRDDDEAYKDVDHEKSDDDNVDDIKQRHFQSIVVDLT